MNIQKLLGLVIFLLLSNASAQESSQAIIDWAQRVELIIPVDGVVQKVHVNTGQRVKQGELLVELDKRIFKAAVLKADAKVKSEKATHAEMVRELERAQELYDRTVLSDHELQVAKNNEIFAQSKLTDAEAELITAKIALEHASLSAPFNSIILKRSVEKGKAVINKFSYAPLITLAASDRYVAKFTIQYIQSKQVQLGNHVTVNVNNTDYKAKIIALDYIEPKKSISVTAMFKSETAGIHAGISANVSFK